MAAALSDPLLEKSSLYQAFLAEREEILKHKWIKSEEAGRDIGFEAALVDWMLHHRREWRESRGTMGVH
jgi:hypothetical protein